MQKSSKIIKSSFTTEWAAPNGSKVYYHELIMENGDKGSCGLKEKSPPKIWSGAKVTYTIDAKTKIKILSSDMEDPQDDFIQEHTDRMKKGKGKSSQQESFLGYAWSYAKDLVIAGKTMDDVQELKNVAKFIYNEIGEMLKNDR